MEIPWQRAIVVGASSGIGAAISRALAAGGCRVGLVARREAALEEVVGEIRRAISADRASAYVHDVTAYEEVPSLFQHICHDLRGLDLIVYAAGVMPRLDEGEFDFEKDRPTIEVNVLGAIAWLNPAAERFATAGEGTIVGISSVAGDRGRRGSPVYSASKAALDAYLEGLRNRVARRGVVVVTAKPGPVDTPMTRGLGRLPFLISAERAAAAILVAARRRSSVSYVPRRWGPIMFAIRQIPSPLFRRMNV